MSSDKPTYLAGGFHLTLKEFNGKHIADIRRMYKCSVTGDQKPGIPGACLTRPQWEKLVAARLELEKAGKAKDELRVELGAGKCIDVAEGGFLYQRDLDCMAEIVRQLSLLATEGVKYGKRTP